MVILFTKGINDRNLVEIAPKKNGQFEFKIDGSCNVMRHLQLDKTATAAVVLFGNKVRQPDFQLPEVPSLIFNQISDPDSHKGALERCVQLCEQVPCPVINRPEKILATTRERVSEMLRDIPGVVLPRTIRCQPKSPTDVFKQAEAAGLKFPVIVRLAGAHGGKASMLIDGRDDLAKLDVYPFDGSEFYLTEFVDYKDRDGLYRKLRIVVVDGKPLFRHLLADEQWMIHAASLDFMDKRPELYEEEKQALAGFVTKLAPRIQPAIDAITERMGLEYFGIDCHIDEAGELLVFEANANMNVFFNTRSRSTKEIGIIRKHLRRLVEHRAKTESEVSRR
jgi:glutathione synthase/RimK-type ligase-like ATP-grasp enzyme